jgi:hypothetical protein
LVAVQQFKGFFSYAHQDAQTDPKLINAFSSRLERRVTVKLTNARFMIWKDTDNLRTGERWDDRIRATIASCQVFIVLMTPKWFESRYCLQEYEFFHEVERAVGVGEYVVPLLARSIERQLPNFDSEQRKKYNSLWVRQHRKTIATDFLALSDDERDRAIDTIADDIEGMIERLRRRPLEPNESKAAFLRKAKRKAELATRPHNFEHVDFVSAAEIAVEPKKGNELRGVFAHISFVERLYLQTPAGRVEFSIRRAYLSIDDGGSGKLRRNEDWVQFSTRGSVYYVTYMSAPSAITVCMNPAPGQKQLSDLPLPIAENENYWSKPAVTAPDTDISDIRASLNVSFCPEGLYLSDADSTNCSPVVSKKIAAILGVLAARQNAGLVRRDIPVRERK